MIDSNYFEDFLSFLPLAVCFVDSDGYIVKVNEQMEKILGYKEHELIDVQLEKLFGDRADEVLLKEVKDKEMKVSGKNEDIPVIVFSEKRISDEGTSVFIAISDLTRAKKIEKKMEEKVEELERFNRLATGRELRMVELKRDKKKLKRKVDKLKEKIDKLKKNSKKNLNASQE